jgi:ATP:ADP antiporter, AAA family
VPAAEGPGSAAVPDAVDALEGSGTPPAPSVFALTDPATRRRWARAIAVSLGAVALAGFVTDAVAAAQLLDEAGPGWLALVWPIGGLGLLAAALMQSRFVDRFARLPMLTGLLVGYAAAFAVVGVLFATSAPNGLAAGLAWLLADQMNFLVPLVMWALAGDVFSAGQGVTTFPWISRLLFAGQIAGLAVAAVALALFDGPGLSLAWLLVIPPVVCVAVAIYLPRALRDATTGAGHGRDESSWQSVRDSIAYIRSLPSFEWLLWTSFAVLGAGIVIEFSFLDVAAAEIDGASDLQTFYAGTALIGFVACWLVQVVATPRLLRRWDVAPALAVLPAVTTLAAGVLIVGGATGSVVVAAVGVLLWRLPRWSLDGSARQAALATLPDERRARSAFLIDLVPLAVALIAVPIPIGLSRLVDERWAAPVVAAVLAIVAVVTVRGVRRHWDDTQLSWRLKRRQRLG